MPTQTFKQLLVWQKAHEFVLVVYKYTNSFPRTELYALASQFKKAAISIAPNIAEGYKKKGKADKARLMNIAQGSIEECQYYLILSNDLGYGKNDRLSILLDEIGKMLESYISKILSSNS